MTTPAVKLKNITKRFPGVVANQRVNFEVLPGEIHALLGENGAGKSTLMSILTGLYRPDEGEIELYGERVELKGPADAIARGIGIVYQHFKLVPTLTVAENVALGMRQPRLGLKLSEIAGDLAGLSQKLGLSVKPTARVNTLSVGEQQRVEIIKALYLGAKILALDEPTANLTPQESEGLFEALRTLAAQDYAIIFISHKLEEVVRLANRATILRRGESVATLALEGKSGEKEKLAGLMIGRDAGRELAGELGLDSPIHPPSDPVSASKDKRPVLLEVTDLWARGDSRTHSLRGVTFKLAPGELLGVVGVAGNGQKELAESLAGLRPVERGSIILEGQPVQNKSARALNRAGLAYVPEDRLGMGLAAGLNLEDNFLLRSYWKPAMRRGLFLRRSQAQHAVGQAVTQYDIRVGDPYAPARLMSGGNLQKLLLARELASGPRLLIVANPTRGLDIGASAYVHARLRQARDQGAGVLVILEDLDEALTLCDRLLVFYNGRVVGEAPAERSAANLQRIGLWMLGGTTGAPETVEEQKT